MSKVKFPAFSTSMVLTVAGLFVTGMLVVSKFLGESLPCGGWTGCAAATFGRYSTLFGIPLSLLGFGGFASIYVCLFCAAKHGSRASRTWLYAAYSASIGGTFVSLILIGLALLKLPALCIWCLTSAVIFTMVMTSMAVELNRTRARSEQTLRPLAAKALTAGMIALALVSWFVFRQGSSVVFDPKAVLDVSSDSWRPKDSAWCGNAFSSDSVVLFLDMQCPACQHALRELRANVERTRKFKLVVRHMPLSNHQGSREAAVLLEIANERGKFWVVTKKAFEAEDPTLDDWRQAVLANGISEREVAFDSLSRKRATSRVVRDIEFSRRLGFGRAPTIVILNPLRDPEIVSFARARVRLHLQ